LSPEDNDPAQVGCLATSLQPRLHGYLFITNAAPCSWTTKLIANQQVPQHIPTEET
jgi:hypothetical protein